MDMIIAENQLRHKGRGVDRSTSMLGTVDTMIMNSVRRQPNAIHYLGYPLLESVTYCYVSRFIKIPGLRSTKSVR
jgi:hypothetical protein